MVEKARITITTTATTITDVTAAAVASITLTTAVTTATTITGATTTLLVAQFSIITNNSYLQTTYRIHVCLSAIGR